MHMTGTTQTRRGLHPLPTTMVTGATSGIARELALQLTAAGIPVVAIGRNPEALRALAAHSTLVTPYAADLSELDQLPALVARILLEHPEVGCLINNAGVQFDLRFDDVRFTNDALRHEVTVNLMAPLVLTRALLPHLRSRPRSRIVNITSGLAYAPKRTAAVYSATKAGLHLFTRALRVQMAGTSVSVVEAVMPLVDTPMTEGRGTGKLPAAHAAQQLIAGLLAGQPDIHVGKARWLPLLQRWAPGVLARILQRA